MRWEREYFFYTFRGHCFKHGNSGAQRTSVGLPPDVIWLWLSITERLLCCQLLSMSDSRNKGFFQVFSWCLLDFMAAISPWVGKPPLCSHFRRIGNSSSTWKKSFIFYWNQLHWTFHQVLSRFNSRTRNALFCLHFEIFGCCFNPLIYLPPSALWGWRLLARKAKQQKSGTFLGR